MKKRSTKSVVRFTLIILITNLTLFNLFAQQKEYYDDNAEAKIPSAKYMLEGNQTSYPAYVKFELDNAIPKNEFFAWLSDAVPTSANTSFRLLRQETDELGYTHYKYAELFKGIPVNYAEYHLETLNDNVVTFNGEIFDLPDMPVTPQISEEKALQLAMNYIGSDNYMWENPYWESEIKRIKDNPQATYFPTGKLCWDKPLNSGSRDNNFRLAYSFDIWAEGGLGSQTVTVDAQTGAIVNGIPLESDCTSANVNTIWNGSQTISTDKYTANDFRLRDDCQAAAIWIRDWNSTTTTASPVEIENTTNTWTTMNERFGATVLWNVEQAYAYYLNVHSRNSYDNSNGGVNGYINAVFSCTPPPSPCYYTDNASMSFTGGTLKVGLGSSGTLPNSWGTLDIIGHEYTHAVTGSTSMLVYSNESGALNESFSDIFGEAVERYITGSTDWLVGNDRTSGAIRSMSNPNAGNDPDTYLGTFWYSGSNDNGGVHTNSGVQNFWFYLLTTGGNGTNDNGDNYDVTGIGFNNTRSIAYRNNTVKLTSGSNYAAARAGAIDAAEDLFGSCSDFVIQVKNAWYACGVGNPGMPEFNSAYFEPETCTSDAFSIDLQSKRTANLVTPAYNWTANYNGITGGAGAGSGLTIDETLVNNTMYPVLAVYTVTPSYDGCTGASFTINKTINPRPTSANSSTSVLCSGDAFSIDLQNNISNGVPSNFTWTVNYNGLTGGNGGGSGDFINESLVNNTGAIATAVYTVSPESEQGDCAGSAFTVSVQVPPELSIDAGENQTVYYGYPPAECAHLSWSNATGGTPPYSIMWSTGENTQSIKVCPGAFTTTYYVTVTDANGCMFTDSVTVCVIDVRCGKKLNKVEICHIPPGTAAGNSHVSKTLCIAVSAVAAHLEHGDQLAACGTDQNCPTAKSKIISSESVALTNELTVHPNPFRQSATIKFTSVSEGNASLKIFDFTGNEIKELFNGDVEAGIPYEVEITANNISKGINFCKLQLSDGSVMIQKIILQ